MPRYSGNIPAPHDYGEMYQTDNAVATTINTVDVWEQIVNFSQGEVRGFTVSSSTFTAPHDGLVSITWAASTAAAGTNKDFEIAPSIDDSILTKGKIKRKYATADIGASAGQCLAMITAGQQIKLEIRNVTDDTDITVSDCNFQVHYE